MKIAVFGSAFNPPTYSHLQIIESLMDKFDKVLVVPCFSHNFGKKMVSYDDRVKMAELLINHINRNVELSRIEEEIFQDRISRTYDLLKTLKERNPTDDFIFICGEDNGLGDAWKKFYNYELIDKEFGKLVVPDLGMVRSTILRQRLKNAEPAEDLTKKEIIDYIHDNHIDF